MNRIIIGFSTFIMLYIIGCSTYTLPENSKVIVAKEKLSSYNPKNFSIPKKVRKLPNEDELIVKAIWLEEQHNYAQSNRYYNELYNATHAEEYLLKELNTAYNAGIVSPNVAKLIKYTEMHPNNLQAKRLLLSFQLKDRKYDEAKKVAQKLTVQSQQAVDFELAANPYIFTSNYQEALTLLEKAYEKTLNEDILLKIVTIEVNYLHDIDAGVQRLEEHTREHGCSEKICLQLVAIYLQQNRVDKLIPIYKSLAKRTQKDIYVEKVIESYIYNKNLSGAIEYLENEHSNNELLYTLYMEEKNYLKAHKLAKQLQDTTQSAKWYAESAISLYESLTDKNNREQLKQVVALFEKARTKGMQNPIYLNYYGYTLIDKDIDIKKGINIINQALTQEPENTYFLDSLAWGEYKLGNCSDAYTHIKKVVKIEGLKDEELIEHWNTIDGKCKQ